VTAPRHLSPPRKAGAAPGATGAVRLRADAAVLLLGLLGLLLWEASGLDLQLSHAYGTVAGFAWREAWLTRTLLHDGGRWLAEGVMVALLLWAWRGQPGQVPRAQRWQALGAIVLCLLLVPLLKHFSATSCPWDLAAFGGVAHYVPHWQLLLRDGGPGHCFPSGHAVAAFAFLPLYFTLRQRHPWAARYWLAAVCVAGALFGWAQLARGAHFASHTLWSAWLCWSLGWLVCGRERELAPALSAESAFSA
jgi:membrane-associated PAP2 superfamily phosphatase